MILTLIQSIALPLVFLVAFIILIRQTLPLLYLELLTRSAQRFIMVIRFFKSQLREHIKSQYSPDEWERVKHRFDDDLN